MKLSGIALRNIKRNKKRSILSITATGIATYAIVFMFSFIGGLENDMKDVAYNYSTGEILIRNIDYDEKSFSLDRAIDDYKNVVALLRREFPRLQLSPRIKFPSTVLDRSDPDKSYISFGVAVNFKTEESYLNLSDKIIEGRIPKGPREVIIGHGLAKELNLNVGDKFTPITSTRRGASTGITFKIVGLGKFSDSGFSNKTFIVSLDQLPKMLKMEGSVSDILIKGVADKELESSVGKINEVLKNSGYSKIEAYSWKDVGVGYSFLQMANFAYTIMGFFFFFLASTVIANTMLMVVFERRKEIGTITAMGMTKNEVIRLFFLEAFVLGVLGAGSGVLLGIVTVIPLSFTGIDMSSATGGIDMGASFNIFPVLTLKSTLFVFCYSVFVASLVSYFPSKGAAKVDPVVALRSE